MSMSIEAVISARAPRHQIDLTLDRIKLAADTLHLSRFDCPVIIVAGTNGKGSTIACLEAIYHAAGYRVGATTSPHLHAFNERIRVEGLPVAEAVLLDLINKMDGLLDEQLDGLSLSFFERATLLALMAFKHAECEVVLLEVGLGGRLDAVNVVEPDVCIVTSIGLDHQAYLGDTLEAIAREKAGIFRPHMPAVCAKADVIDVLQSEAEKVGALWELVDERDFNLSTVKVKPSNAACAWRAANLLQHRLPVNEAVIKGAIECACAPGRYEIISAVPCVLVDVAHNPASATYLAKRLRDDKKYPVTVAIVGMLADKDRLGTLSPLLDLVDHWVVTDLDTDRAANPLDIVASLQTLGVESCYTASRMDEALEKAYALLSSDDRILVFGSFYTVAAVIEEIRS